MLLKRKFENEVVLIKKKKKEFPLETIISGGQSGADIGALKSAESLGIATGGYAPIGFVTVDGKNPELGTRFHLKELNNTKLSLSQMYVQRSIMNIENSDGTLAFRLFSSIGTDKSIGYCLTKKWKVLNDYESIKKTKYNPLLIINTIDDQKKDSTCQKIRSFIYENNIKTLNVCGHRESKKNDNSFEKAVMEILKDAISSELKYKS